MALKSFLVPAFLGATGTTTIALPSAYAYGKGLVKEAIAPIEKDIANLEQSNDEITGQNNVLVQTTKQTENETNDIREQSKGKQTQIAELTAEKDKAKQNSDSAWKLYDNLSPQNEKLQREKTELLKEKLALKAKVQTLNQQLNKEKTQTKITIGNKTTRAYERIKQEIDSLDRAENKNRVYSFLKERIGERGGNLTDIAGRKWKCKEITWSKESAQEGIAYCVVLEGHSEISYGTGENLWKPQWTNY